MGKPKKHLEPLEIEVKPRTQADSQPTPPAGPVFHWPEGAQPPGDADSNVPPIPLDGMGLISMAKHVGQVLDKKKRRQVDSHSAPIPQCASAKPTITFDQTPKPTKEQGQGDTAAAESVAVAAGENLPREAEVDANRRWRREGRSIEVARFRDAARAEYVKAHPGCKRRDAHEWAWQAAIQSFPPGESLPPPAIPAPDEGGKAHGHALLDEPAADAVAGLYSIPASWPPLSDNASLQAELGWVQSQRLAVVETRGNSTVVHLDRASCPAPSKAALSWLETSIRSYAKYVDVVSRALAGAQDEQEHVRRERTRLEDIRALLREMQPSARCASCGRVHDTTGK